MSDDMKARLYALASYFGHTVPSHTTVLVNGQWVQAGELVNEVWAYLEATEAERDALQATVVELDKLKATILQLEATLDEYRDRWPTEPSWEYGEL